MDARQRREEILRRLRSSAGPVSAGTLAEICGVSRQIIVGDVALLRAAGEEITATPRGYALAGPREAGFLRRTVACLHGAAETETELNLMVDNGCTVLDVIVEHPVYGQLTGALQLRSRYDVRRFLERSAEAAPLSSLTDGLHLHTLLCPDADAFERVKSALAEAGILLNGQL